MLSTPRLVLVIKLYTGPTPALVTTLVCSNDYNVHVRHVSMSNVFFFFRDTSNINA
jgi:hypothetical protein